MITTPETETTSANILNILEQKIEQARNIQTITEHDTIRLKKLKTEQESAIREMVDTKSELNNEILNLKTNKQNLFIDVSNLEKSIVDLNDKIKESEIKLAVILNNESTIIKERELNEALYNKKNTELIQREESIKTREENIKEVEKKVSDKHGKIVAFVSDLQK